MSLDILYKTEYKFFFRIAYKYTKNIELAQDVVQDSFLQAFKKINTLKDKSALKSWVSQIVGSYAINTIKHKCNNYEEIVDNMYYNETFDDLIFQDQINQIVKDEIDKLPDKQMKVLEYVFYDGLKVVSISKLMQTNYDTTKANYRHGLLKLKENLKNIV